jgi:hypothetical protein
MSLLIHKASPGWNRIPGQSQFGTLQKQTGERLASLAHQLETGEIDNHEWYIRFANILLESHKDSWILGRRRAGDFGAEDIYDELAGRAKVDQESEWLLNFFHDLETGRYLDAEGKLKTGIVVNRSIMYSGKLRGTANDSFIQASGADDSFEWSLGGAELHCSDCPKLASMSPWLKDELGAWPGSGDTPCLTNCKCSIVRLSDGLAGFAPV